jgi:hypothetical protein
MTWVERKLNTIESSSFPSFTKDFPSPKNICTSNRFVYKPSSSPVFVRSVLINNSEAPTLKLIRFWYKRLTIRNVVVIAVSFKGSKESNIYAIKVELLADLF